MPLFSHIDMRVRDAARAFAFYDALLNEFEFESPDKPTDEWPTWRRRGGERNGEFFGYEVDANLTPNQNRISFWAASKADVDRIAAAAKRAGALNMEGPAAESERYYAAFFEDPDGNKLEVCFVS